MKKYIFLLMTTLLMTVFGSSPAWAEKVVTFTLTSSSAPTAVGEIYITGGTASNNGYNASTTISVNATTGYTITAISFTFANNTTDRNGGEVTASSGTYTPTGSNTTNTANWSGSANSVTFTPTGKFRITSMTVTYTNGASGDATQDINIADLRFEHQTYNPGRNGVAGFNITTTGWQSYTTVSGDSRIYTLLLSSTGSNNSITIAPNSSNSSRKIKQVVLYGAGGINTFNNATVTSANTRKYSDEASNVGALVWENAEGANSATISINSTDRPHIHAIRIVTDGQMNGPKQSIALSFAPNSGTASTKLTDFSIDGRVKASIGGGNPESFRADEFTTSSITNANSAASFNQFHISTSRVGVNTGASAGTATITATFAGNNFYEAATSGTYTLKIQDNSPKTLAISVDDMRISKKVSSNGLNATSGLDRVMGGFEFKFEGGDNVKFNNGDFLIFRNSGGKVTITPQTTGEGTVTITRVDINTLSGYTDGVVEVSGLTGDQTINGVSSYSFANLNSDAGVSSFTMTTKSGNVYVTGFTIYYTDANGVLNSTKVTPTITLKRGETEISSGTSETVSSSDTYTSPTITGTTPANFDFTITSNNTNVATVAATNWSSSSLVSLQGTEGTATITATAAESNFFDAATFTYTVEVSSTNSKKWDFTTLDVANTINDEEWEKSGDYYNNKFITTKTTNGAAIESGDAYYTSSNTKSQIYGLLFGRHDSSGLGTGKIRLWSSYLTTNNSAVVIAVPASEGQKVIVTFDGGNGTTQQGFDFTNATLEGDNTATSIKSDETQRIATLTAGTGGYVTLKFTASKVKLYSIEVKDETRKTLTLADINNTYNRATSTTTFSHYVSFTASDGATDALTYEGDKSHLHITSSNTSVLDVSNATVSATNFGSGSTFAFDGIEAVGAGKATLTITFDGNNEYKPTSYTSQVYTVSGALGAFAVQADDQAIQQGQRSPIEPIITNNSGQAIGIRGTTGNYETYVLDEEEDLPNYATYFDFTYTAGSGSGTNYSNITVDTDGTINTTDDTGIGATRNIAITATVKGEYKSAFSGSVASASTNMTVTIRAKNAGVNPCTYYWNSDLTNNEVTGPGSDKDWNTGESSSMGIFGSSGTFSSGFPNGRMMYVKPKNADDVIFFSYAVNAEPSDFPAQPKYDKNKKIYIYRRGIPIHIDDDISSDAYVRVNVATASYDASTKKYTLNSGVVKMKFIMTTHDRPAQPTYDPISPASDPTLNQDGHRIMNTSQNVVAYGETEAQVYGKFSTSSIYTTEQLINEESVSSGKTSVPVVSTEVAKRRFTTVQITKNSSDTNYGGYGEYISEQAYTEYWYRFDTDLRLYYNNGGNRTPLTDFSINTGSNTSTVLPKVTWYNKRNYDDPSNYSLGITQDVDNLIGKVTYSIGTTSADRSGATGVNVDETTGIVTAPNNKDAAGWVRVTATYSGGEEHGGKSGEPQYKSTTDEAIAYFTVYITDPTSHTPRIVPTTRNFANTIKYQVQAPLLWDVMYTTDGSEPSKTNGTKLNHSTETDYTSTTNWIEVGSDMTVGSSITIKAIAYDPSESSTAVSTIVSETYTKKDAIPDPIFNPDGTGDGYIYNTSSLTVQIACAKAGSVIYYTISDLNAAEKPDPVIGAENTYMYSGLSKVTVTGEQVIKAVAYDPVNGIYSNVVTSTYRYSSKMLKPYFQISNDGGKTWQGLNESGNLVDNGTYWNNGQPQAITPTTQIRIIDPNPVKGTIFYTLNGLTPSDDTNSLVYTEGYPFTVGKTTTGKAITTLEDAASDVASAEFTIETTTYGNVWEAVNNTLTGEEGKKGIYEADGFVISTNPELGVKNSGTTVNMHSLATGNTDNIQYAQKFITATFGGYLGGKATNRDWTEMTIADAAIGEPIGGIGMYSIKSKENAWYELDKNYNHAYMTTLDGREGTPAVHDKTFKVPAKGTYVRFEPEKDGDLTIWVLQQGALLYEDDKYFIDNVLRVRPVYLIDEQGTSYPVKTVNGVPQMWSSARLSENWAKIQAMAAKNDWMDSNRKEDGTMDESETYTQYLRLSDGTLTKTKPTGDVTVVEKLSDVPGDADLSKYYKKVINKGTSAAESANIFRLYQDNLDNNHVSVGDPIKPFPIHTGGTLTLNDGSFIDTSNDGTGYVLASGGYAKYTFEVKAGKTYYFMGVNTKIGIRGFQFVPTETEERTKVEYDAKNTTSIITSENMGKPVDVTLKRAFKADTWAAIVLPFSVSTTQLEKVFGAGTSVIHFNKIVSPSTLLFMKHKHQMIVAGTPVIIKPKITVDATTGVKFEGVQIEANSVDVMQDNLYKFVGTFVQTETNKGLKNKDYFFSTSGKFTRWTGNDTAMKGSLAWIQPLDYNNAPALSIGMFSGDDDETTALFDIEIEDLTTGEVYYSKGVYDLNGRKVSEGSLSGLPKGVYIVNGKKVVVD